MKSLWKVSIRPSDAFRSDTMDYVLCHSARTWQSDTCILIGLGFGDFPENDYGLGAAMQYHYMVSTNFKANKIKNKPHTFVGSFFVEIC